MRRNTFIVTLASAMLLLVTHGGCDMGLELEPASEPVSLYADRFNTYTLMCGIYGLNNHILPKILGITINALPFTPNIPPADESGFLQMHHRIAATWSLFEPSATLCEYIVNVVAPDVNQGFMHNVLHHIFLNARGESDMVFEGCASTTNALSFSAIKDMVEFLKCTGVMNL